MIVVNRVPHLPADFGALAHAPDTEAMRMVQRLADGYRSGSNLVEARGEGCGQRGTPTGSLAFVGSMSIPGAPRALRESPPSVCTPRVKTAWAASALLKVIAAHATDHIARLTAFAIDQDVVGLSMTCGFPPVTGVNRRSLERELVGAI